MADKPRPAPTILRAATRTEVPWKNGGGITSEIAVYPEGSKIENFGWRISTALVEAAGPFSMFEGVDRILTVLEGKLALRFAADNSEVILGCGQSLAFAGDVEVKGIPLSGPVRDLNVMVRRSEWRAEVSTSFPHMARNETLIAIAAQPASGLAELDAVILEPGVQLRSDFVGHFVRLRPATSVRL